MNEESSNRSETPSGESHASTTGGRPVLFGAITPWPDPVNGAVLLSNIVAALTRYVVLPQGSAIAIALWILHAHAHNSFVISPILGIVSPEKRCGKTTLLAIIQHLVPRPLQASSVTQAAVFRIIEMKQPTLLIDEADTFLRGNTDLIGVLNSGHNRFTALVIRVDGDKHDTRTFSTWSPKAIATIGRLPTTLEDRSIVVPMRRRMKQERVQHLRQDRMEEFLPLLRQASRWAKDAAPRLSTADPQVPEELHDRAADNWRPLLAIAEVIGGVWTATARRVSEKLSTSAEDNSIGVKLLRDVRAAFEVQQANALPSAMLVATLINMEESIWAEYGNGEGLSPNALARMLKPFGPRPSDMWLGGTEGRCVKGYQLSDFEDAFTRYLSTEPRDSRGTDVVRLESAADSPPLANLADASDMTEEAA